MGATCGPVKNKGHSSMARTTVHAAATFEVKFINTLLCNVIDGEGWLDVVNPSTGQVVATSPISGARDVNAAFDAPGRPRRRYGQVKVTEVARKAVAAFIATVVAGPRTHSRANVGIDKPRTDGDRPAWYCAAPGVVIPSSGGAGGRCVTFDHGMAGDSRVGA